MPKKSFQCLLEAAQREQKFICVGLDSDAAQLPAGQTQLSFNQAIVGATHDLVAAYKLNSAFYEACGAAGWEALRETIAFIHERAGNVAVILDAKRADIANTSSAYAVACFKELKADAVTLNPYLGGEALQPFLNYKDKGCFILCRTSNPGSKEFQDLEVDGEPLYLKVARQVMNRWNENKNCGLVVGGTSPEEIKKVREAVPDLPFLIPGIGTQGGSLKEALKYGRDATGRGALINISRDILFASKGADFAKAARKKVLEILNVSNSDAS